LNFQGTRRVLRKGEGKEVKRSTIEGSGSTLSPQKGFPVWKERENVYLRREMMV